MKTLLILTVTLFQFYVFGQSWSTLVENPRFTIAVAEANFKNSQDDIDHQRLIFKYENLTSTPITIEFKREVTFGTQTQVQDQLFEIHLAGNETKAYTEDSRDKTYYIFKSDNLGYIKSKLGDFKFLNLRNF